MKILGKKIDVGLAWAKYVNTWSQIGVVASTVNFSMMLGVFYTTTLKPTLDIPLWAYILFVLSGVAMAIVFALKVGISGYYRFFSKTSELSETNRRVQENDRKLRLIMDKLGIEDAGKVVHNPTTGNDYPVKSRKKAK